MRLAAPFGALVAISGALRAVPAYGILALQVKLAGKRSTYQTFLKTWATAVRMSWLMSGSADNNNRFDVPWQYLVYDRLVRHMALRHDWKAPVVIGDPLHRKSAGPLFIAMPHCRLEQAVLRHICFSTGRRTAMIKFEGRQEAVDDRARQYGSATTRQIHADLKTAIRARAAISEGFDIYACVDFTTRKKGRLSQQIWVSANIFELAMRLKLPVLFAIPIPRPDGSIYVHLQDPGLLCYGSDFAKAFIEFQYRLMPKREPRQIGDRNMSRSTKDLKKGLWIPTRTRARA